MTNKSKETQVEVLLVEDNRRNAQTIVDSLVQRFDLPASTFLIIEKGEINNALNVYPDVKIVISDGLNGLWVKVLGVVQVFNPLLVFKLLTAQPWQHQRKANELGVEVLDKQNDFKKLASIIINLLVNQAD